MLTYSQRKSHRETGSKAIQATVQAAVEAVSAQQEAERAESRAVYAERHAAVPYTREQLDAATRIRTLTGWHKVVRVNVKTVTVETEYSWNDRWPIAKILEVRTLGGEHG